MLARALLDGLDQVQVPFAERYVHAWQLSAPEPGMDVQTLITIVEVRSVFHFRNSSAARLGRFVANHSRDSGEASLPNLTRRIPRCTQAQRSSNLDPTHDYYDI